MLTIKNQKFKIKNLEQRRPQTFRSAAFVNPGSYLLSRDLSSDYHRRADVSLPGSEWDRVGPSGYDHQAAASQVHLSIETCNLSIRLPDYQCCLVLLKCCLRQGFICGQADIRVACVC